MGEAFLSVSDEERLDLVRGQKAVKLKLFSIPQKAITFGLDFWMQCKLLILRRGLLPGEKHSRVIEK